MSEKYLVSIPEEHCAQAFITTDLDDNQITAFHPGAMNHSHRIKVPAHDGITIGVIAPDSREGMLQHAEQFKAAEHPVHFRSRARPCRCSRARISGASSRWPTGWRSTITNGPCCRNAPAGRPRTSCKHVKALIITRGARRVGHPRRRPHLPHSLRPGGRRGRPDRLRRRLPRRPDSRHPSRARLGNHRPYRVADGRHQDRRPRHAESQHSRRRNSRSRIAPPSASHFAPRAESPRPASISGTRNVMSNSFLFTSESVSEGHPDKVVGPDLRRRARCDSGAGQVLARRRRDAVQTGLVVHGGRDHHQGGGGFPEVARETIKKIGYDNTDYGIDYRGCAVLVAYDKQSPDIAQGVDEGRGSTSSRAPATRA